MIRFLIDFLSLLFRRNRPPDGLESETSEQKLARLKAQSAKIEAEADRAMARALKAKADYKAITAFQKAARKVRSSSALDQLEAKLLAKHPNQADVVHLVCDARRADLLRER